MRFTLLLGAVLGCLLVLATSAVAAPAPGDFDFSFGNRGYVGGDTYVAAAEGATAVGPKGETFVLEPRQAAVGSGVELTLARFDADGERDPTFGEAAVLAQQPVPGARDALAVDSQGRPLIAELNRNELLPVAEATPPKQVVRLELIVARFGRNGRLDPGFGEGGQVRTAIESPVGTAPVLAAEPDQSVLVGAEANSETLQNAVVVTHLEADGSLDKAFGTNGLLAFKPGGASRPTALALTPGSGFELGLSQCCGGEYAGGLMPGVARFLAAGGADPSLAGKGEATVPRGAPSVVESIAPGPRGSVLAAVEEDGRGSSVIRVLPSGGLDPTFGKGGQALLGPELGVGGVVAITTDGEDRIVGVAGRGEGGVKVFRLRKLGQPDGTFGGGRGVPALPVRAGHSHQRLRDPARRQDRRRGGMG